MMMIMMMMMMTWHFVSRNCTENHSCRYCSYKNFCND